MLQNRSDGETGRSRTPHCFELPCQCMKGFAAAAGLIAALFLKCSQWCRAEDRRLCCTAWVIGVPCSHVHGAHLSCNFFIKQLWHMYSFCMSSALLGLDTNAVVVCVVSLRSRRFFWSLPGVKCKLFCTFEALTGIIQGLLGIYNTGWHSQFPRYFSRVFYGSNARNSWFSSVFHRKHCLLSLLFFGTF